MRTEVLPVTPDDAFLALRESPYQHQRRLKSDVVDSYADQMVKGRWRGGDSMIVYGRVQGGAAQRVMMNGQHRYHAVVKSGVTADFTIQFVDYDTQREMDEAYAIFDTSKRSMNDRLNAIGSWDRSGVTRTFFLHGTTALRFIYAGGRHKTREFRRLFSDPMEVDALAAKWDSELYLAYRTIRPASASDANLMRRTAILAAMLLTYRYFPTGQGAPDPYTFWLPFVENDGLSKGDPRHTLRMTAATNDANSATAQWDLFCQCLRAFQGWVDGDELYALRPNGKARLRGTHVQDGVNWIAIANKEF